MDSQTLTILILSLLCIIGIILVNTKKENFYQADKPKIAQCKTPCVECDTDETKITGYNCNINTYADISGLNINTCIKKCLDTDCIGCKEFIVYDSRTKRQIRGNYTNDLDDYLQKCNTDPQNHQFCSPCVEACYLCNDPNRCNWVDNNEDVEGENKKEFNSRPFQIRVIPEDRGAVIFWEENVSNSLVSRYEIFIYRKAEVNLDKKKQQTPLIIRRETMNNVGNDIQKTFKITGLVNNETYSINVNKISRNKQIVKASNTVDIVPSKVNLVDFSSLNKKDTLKQSKNMSRNLFDNLTGKQFNITL